MLSVDIFSLALFYQALVIFTLVGCRAVEVAYMKYLVDI